MPDFSQPAVRRRFFLDRASKGARGAGSDMARLITAWTPQPELVVHLQLLGGIPAMLVGAHATSAYAPQRQTIAVDCIVPHASYAAACSALENSGLRKTGELLFASSALELYGSSWVQDGAADLDIMSSPEPWVSEAFRAPESRDRNGARVIGLPWLVLMKIDASRSVDQGDLSRTLGRLSTPDLEAVIRTVVRHHPDGSLADDLRQYAEIGRWEYQKNTDRGSG